jgi:NADH-quinone oxidoreductase subunit N
VEMQVINPGQIWYMGPVLITFAAALLMLIWDVAARLIYGRGRGINLLTSAVISLAGMAAAVAQGIYLWLGEVASGGPRTVFTALGPPPELITQIGEHSWTNGALVLDYFALFVVFAVSLMVVFTTLVTFSHARRHGLFRAELFPLLLISASGMMLIGFSRDLLITFIAIEILSIPLYVLCGLDRKREASLESSLKYFLLGAFASGFFIYGAALVYGMAGHLNYLAIAEYFKGVTEEVSPIMLIGLALVGVGFGFKMALVPFHAWAPDVYQGAPTPITGFMAVGVKLGMFAAAIRLIIEALPVADVTIWRDALVLFAVLSMVVGNLLALHQMSAKRLLAYSAIAHTGYLAVGLAAGSPQAASSILVYMTAYTLAGLGVFALISYLAPSGQDDIYLDEMHDLWNRAPASSLALTILLLSMGGLPLTLGFIGKFMVFMDAWRAGLTGLVIFAVLNSVVSFYYYLRFVIVMYMQPRASGAVELKLMPMAPTFIITGIVCTGLTLLLGVAPRFLLEVVNLCRPGG